VVVGIACVVVGVVGVGMFGWEGGSIVVGEGSSNLLRRGCSL
jgi:hypothetical protein